MVKLDSFSEDMWKQLMDTTSLHVEVNIKDMPFEDKVKFLKCALEDRTVINTNIVANLSYLVGGMNLNDELFADSRVYFKNIEEYVDLKDRLKDEIQQYRDDIAKYFLSAVKSLGVVLPDGRVDIPSTIALIMGAMNWMDFSKIFRVAKFSSDDLVLVNNPEGAIASLVGSRDLFNKFLQAMTSKE